MIINTYGNVQNVDTKIAFQEIIFICLDQNFGVKENIKLNAIYIEDYAML